MTPNEAFRAWWLAQEAREAHEWRKWDGTEEHGIAIADAQTSRTIAAKERFGATQGPLLPETYATARMIV